MKKQNLALGALIAAVVLGISLILQASKDSGSVPVQTGNNRPADQADDDLGGNVLFGTLKRSDTPGKGNLMLVSPGFSTIYIQTGRNFDNLLDKKVAVQIEGTATNFKVIDIRLNE